MINYFIGKKQVLSEHDSPKFFFFETILETGSFLRCKSTEFGEQVFPMSNVAIDGTISCGRGIDFTVVEVNTDTPESKQSEGITSTETAVAKAYLELREKAKVKRGGWVPDFNDKTQFKYWPAFDMRSGFGFSRAGYGGTYSYSFVGSRLCFPTEKMAKEFALENIELYRIVYCTE